MFFFRFKLTVTEYSKQILLNEQIRKIQCFFYVLFYYIGLDNYYIQHIQWNHWIRPFETRMDTIQIDYALFCNKKCKFSTIVTNVKLNPWINYLPVKWRHFTMVKMLVDSCISKKYIPYLVFNAWIESKQKGILLVFFLFCYILILNCLLYSNVYQWTFSALNSIDNSNIECIDLIVNRTWTLSCLSFENILCEIAYLTNKIK